MQKFLCGDGREDGHEFKLQASDINRGRWCWDCSGRKPLSTSTVSDMLAKINMSLIGEYVNSRTNITIKCNNCENEFEKKINWKTLYENVCKFSAFYKTLNLKKGDCVAAYVPNNIETIISFLACAKNGQIWSSCSPDFGIQGVVDRFFQIEPQVLIVADHYFYNSKKFNILDRVPEILKKIPIFNHFLKFISNIYIQEKLLA